MKRPDIGRVVVERRKRVGSRRRAELDLFVFGRARILPKKTVSARVRNGRPPDGNRRFRPVGFRHVVRRVELDLFLILVSAEVDRSVGDTGVPRKIDACRRILIVSFVDRLRVVGERIVSRIRVRKERFRRVVG